MGRAVAFLLAGLGLWPLAVAGCKASSERAQGDPAPDAAEARLVGGGLKPNAQALPPASPVDTAGNLKGKYPSDFFHVGEIDRRLHKLVGRAAYEKCLNATVTQNATREGGDELLVLDGASSACSASVVYDTSRDKLHVCVVDPITDKQIDVFSEDWAHLPPAFGERVLGVEHSHPELVLEMHKR